MICDNIQNCHDNEIINETKDGIRVRCKICGEINVIRFDLNGRYDNREYSRIFKKDLLQPSENLYYKIYPTKMSVA